MIGQLASVDRRRRGRAVLPLLSDRRRSGHLRRRWTPVFDRLRYGRRPQTEAVLFAFDLLELTGNDLRRTPLEGRKRALAKLLRKASWALQYNDHIAEAGDIVFRHACKLGFEGIVSKRSLAVHGTGSRAKIRQRQR
jgi:ATP-dependent DNA ligase